MKHLTTLFAMAITITGLAQQVPDYVPTDGLVAWYPFNGNANDESGNGNDGIVNGPISTADHLGADNSALLFDGTDDYIEISNTNGISSSQGLTMSIWFHWEGTNGNDVQQYLFLIANNPNGAITISDDGSCGMNVLNCNCADDINLTSQIVANTWYQATMTYSLNDGLLKMYLNGELVDSSVESMYSYYTTNNPADRFGNYHFNSHYFKGKLNDAGLWNRALTEQEVFALYNTESPTTGCTDELACNYNPEANVNDGGCTYPPFGLTDCEAGGALCGEGTAWDEVSQSCVVANVSDTDFDGCVGINDFLVHLSNFGSGCGPEPAWACGDPLEYHGYDYETVQIGDQCWFAENCRYLPYVNAPSDRSNTEAKYYVWQNTSTDVVVASTSEEYVERGTLYNHPAAMTTCPQGWRLPASEDFEGLSIISGGDEFAGTSLNSTNMGGDDIWEFQINRTGYLNDEGSWLAPNRANFWNASPDPLNSENALYRYTVENEPQFVEAGNRLRAGKAVRCLKE